MATSGQTLNDRINAARYALAGQGLARCVCKATTEEVIGPKKKHLEYLLACTHEPNVSIPQLANLLIERTNHIYWVVVFKALVTVHHLMSYGNERFTQYLASSNYSFELSTFHDKTAGRDFNMSHYIRRYSRYINQKALSYRDLAYDFCKVKRGNEGMLRTMPIDKLLKDLPILQNQLDALLAFDCNANDLNNGVINACFMLLFRDLIGLYACHNDGIINLLNKYFTLNRKMCREAFDLYKKFLIRTDKTADFLRVAEAVGIDKDDIPDLRRAPNSLVDALEAHLENIESNKKLQKSQQPQTSSNNNNAKVAEGVAVLGSLTPPSTRRPSTPSSSTTATGNNKDEFLLNSFKDDEVRRALEEEARVLSQYGTSDAARSASKSSSRGLKSINSTGGSSGGRTTSGGGEQSPKFSVTATAGSKSIDDIFGDADSFGTSNNTTNGFGDSTSSPFDNLGSSATSSGGATGSNPIKLPRPDMDSIKSAILSATTTLEKQLQSNNAGSNNAKTSEPKKASDELFSLLDSGSMMASTQPAAAGLSTGTAQGSQTSAATSTLASLAPFDKPLSTTNGHMAPVLKPGNPFPDMADDFSTNPLIGTAFQAPAVVPTSSSSGSTSTVFKSGPSTANYTNLGGLEGFGDLLQPMSASNNNSNKGGTNSNNNVAFGGTNSKTSFNSGPSLASTGLFKGDLDSTLANLAQNLTFDGISKTKK